LERGGGIALEAHPTQGEGREKATKQEEKGEESERRETEGCEEEEVVDRGENGEGRCSRQKRRRRETFDPESGGEGDEEEC